MEATVNMAVSAWRGSDWHSLAPRLVREHLMQNGPGAVAEVGVWHGELSERLLAIPQVTHLTLIDPWTVMYLKTDDRWYVCGPGTTERDMAQAYRITSAKMERYGDRVTIHRVTSPNGAKQIPDGSLSIVIIDALHFKDQVIEDIEAWRPKLQPNGLMIGDDYSEWFPGVQAGVEAVFGDNHRVLEQTWWTYPNHGGCDGL